MQGSISCDEFDPAHVIAEGAVTVMVLAVNIRRDGTTHSDVARPWRHGKEAPLGDKSRDQIAEHYAGVCRHRSVVSDIE